MYCVNMKEYSVLTFQISFTRILKYALSCVFMVLAENKQYLFCFLTTFFLTVYQSVHQCICKTIKMKYILYN